MWKSAAASVCARLPFCRFRAGAGSTGFSKFFPPAPQPSANSILPFFSNWRRLRNGHAHRNRMAHRRPRRNVPSALEKPPRSGLLPASDRVGDVMLASLDPRSRPFVLGAIGLGATSLLALAIWLGWRGPDETDGKAHAATALLLRQCCAVNRTTAKPPGNDPVWKANPGGEVLIPLSAKPSAGAPVKFVSKVDVLARKKIPADRSFLPADVAADHHAFGHEIQVRRPEGTPMRPPEAQPSFPVRLCAGVAKGFRAANSCTGLTPVYPAQARLLRLEGTVILTAMVDGGWNGGRCEGCRRPA